MKGTRSPSSVLLCGKDGRWKTKLEELPQPNQVVVLLALGDVKYNTLRYPNAHSNIQIIEMPTNISRKEKRITFSEYRSHKGTTFPLKCSSG